jgi:alanine racemase
MPNSGLKVWIEISKSALENNLKILRSRIGTATQIWAVVKSNAYGHGIYDFSPLAEATGVDGFCVDSVIEGATLRRYGVEKPILVLGPTLTDLYKMAVEKNLIITIANRESLEALIKAGINIRPEVHLKLDTGMHRQGFYVKDLEDIIKLISSNQINLTGAYSHLAAAKNPNDRSYSAGQVEEFKKGIAILERAGFKNLMRHIQSSSDALLGENLSFEMIRVGAGLYGFPPSRQIGEKISGPAGSDLRPLLSLQTVISEKKNLQKGDYVGYDLTAQVQKETEIAIIPIGYWHGLMRSLSNKGRVLVAGRSAKVLGLISMDMTAVDVTGIECRVGDKVTIIGRQGSDEITAWEISESAGTVPQEFLTRINPLIKRIVVE